MVCLPFEFSFSNQETVGNNINRAYMSIMYVNQSPNQNFEVVLAAGDNAVASRLLAAGTSFPPT